MHGFGWQPGWVCWKPTYYSQDWCNHPAFICSVSQYVLEGHEFSQLVLGTEGNFLQGWRTHLWFPGFTGFSGMASHTSSAVPEGWGLVQFPSALLYLRCWPRMGLRWGNLSIYLFCIPPPSLSLREHHWQPPSPPSDLCFKIVQKRIWWKPWFKYCTTTSEPWQKEIPRF